MGYNDLLLLSIHVIVLDERNIFFSMLHNTIQHVQIDMVSLFFS